MYKHKWKQIINRLLSLLNCAFLLCATSDMPVIPNYSNTTVIKKFCDIYIRLDF